jgi:hypothetical protein
MTPWLNGTASLNNYARGDNMQRGVVLFAHNSQAVDYFAQAQITAARVHEFLDLPVTVITDQSSVANREHAFDNVIYCEPDASNRRKGTNWLNKGRYQVGELSPYDDTLVLDTDYLINSSRLLEVFGLPGDFACHGDTYWLTCNQPAERLAITSEIGLTTFWATVLRFKKTSRVHQLFGMMAQVQNNYEHYSNIYGFMPYTFRNDYALTIALKTVNGHLIPDEDRIPWPLVHVSQDVRVRREGPTQYTMTFRSAGSDRDSYISVRDLDFHMLGKQNFLELAA